MPNTIHKARRFLPLICYLVTGTAVTTVSQVIANKVTERCLCRESAILLLLIISKEVYNLLLYAAAAIHQ